jgi:Holliday junction resolvasome RuvABC endonuclease subunit
MNNNQTTARILAFDPSTNKMGQTVISFNAITGELLGIEHKLINSAKLPLDQQRVAIFGETNAKINAATKVAKQTMADIEPICVAYESNYINVNTPSAVGPLVALETTMKQAAFEHDPQMPFHMVLPNKAKQTIGAKGNAGKDDVRAAFCKFQPIIIGYTVYRQYINGEHNFY